MANFKSGDIIAYNENSAVFKDVFMEILEVILPVNYSGSYKVRYLDEEAVIEHVEHDVICFVDMIYIDEFSKLSTSHLRHKQLKKLLL